MFEDEGLETQTSQPECERKRTLISLRERYILDRAMLCKAKDLYNWLMRACKFKGRVKISDSSGGMEL